MRRFWGALLLASLIHLGALTAVEIEWGASEKWEEASASSHHLFRVTLLPPLSFQEAPLFAETSSVDTSPSAEALLTDLSPSVVTPLAEAPLAEASPVDPSLVDATDFDAAADFDAVIDSVPVSTPVPVSTLTSKPVSTFVPTSETEPIPKSAAASSPDPASSSGPASMSAPAATSHPTPKNPAIVPPKVTHRVNPNYPASARRRRQSGKVLLKIVVDERGAPSEILFLERSGSPQLDRAAKEAAAKWRFESGRVNGAPEVMSVEQAFDFQLD